jgi:hypothetical protein
MPSNIEAKNTDFGTESSVEILFEKIKKIRPKNKEVQMVIK